MGCRMSVRHHESSRLIAAAPDEVFAFVDDHARFSSHMSNSSWMMGGGRMSVGVDEKKGKALGSHIRLSGRIFGISLYLDEVVIRRDPPALKVWETVGAPRLLIIGAYTMGVQISPEAGGSRVRVFLDYQLPEGWAGYWLGLVFAQFYSRWCVDEMLNGVVRHHTTSHSAAA
jgi:Polyketide cyclase / dehydrase and lipid transport